MSEIEGQAYATSFIYRGIFDGSLLQSSPSRMSPATEVSKKNADILIEESCWVWVETSERAVWVEDGQKGEWTNASRYRDREDGRTYNFAARRAPWDNNRRTGPASLYILSAWISDTGSMHRALIMDQPSLYIPRGGSTGLDRMQSSIEHNCIPEHTAVWQVHERS